MLSRGDSGEDLIKTWDEAGCRFRTLVEGRTAVYPVSYNQLKKEGIAAISEVYEFCGLQIPANDEGIRALLDRNSSRASGREDAAPIDEDQLDIFRTHIRGATTPFDQ